MGLDAVFDVKPTETKEVMTPAVAEKPLAFDTREDQNDDYLLSRNVYRDIIRQGKQAVADINKLAADLESPRAYEVLATMMKQLTETTDRLMELQKKHKELSTDAKPVVEDTGRITVEKAVFVGTSNEMLQHIREKALNGNSE